MSITCDERFLRKVATVTLRETGIMLCRYADYIAQIDTADLDKDAWKEIHELASGLSKAVYALRDDMHNKVGDYTGDYFTEYGELKISANRVISEEKKIIKKAVHDLESTIDELCSCIEEVSLIDNNMLKNKTWPMRDFSLERITALSSATKETVSALGQGIRGFTDSFQQKKGNDD